MQLSPHRIETPKNETPYPPPPSYSADTPLVDEANATLHVSPEIQQLLLLPDSTIDLNAWASGAPVRKQRAVNHNVPESSYRFLDMSLEALLQAVAKLASGYGEDTVETENPSTSPEDRLTGRMLFALGYQPGREQDVPRLRNAAYALQSFLVDYRTLLQEIRESRPDLVPVLEQWSLDIARPAIEAALQVPLGADGQPQYDPRLYDGIVAPVRQPLASYLPELDRRLVERQKAIYNVELARFFEQISKPRTPGVERTNYVGGAASDQVTGSEMGTLLNGNIVLHCSREQLADYAKTIPAGRLYAYNSISSTWMGNIFRSQPYLAAYPNRASGTTIMDVAWRQPSGDQRQMIVGNWNGVHSFSTDYGMNWQPTGAPTSPLYDDLRAEGWRAFLAQRWDDHHKGMARGWARLRRPPVSS